MSAVRVGDILERLEDEVPVAWAESWDRVGLLVGDPDASVSRVFAALDPTPRSLADAVAAKAQVLLTHHPAYLETAPWRPGAGMAGVPFAAVSAGVALINAHTNLDRSPGGADALSALMGWSMAGPLEASSQPVATMVTFVPEAAATVVIAALEGAGAGRIGRYHGCSFESLGKGRFTPMPGSSPAIGQAGTREETPESRIEVVCAPDATEGIAAAIRAAHPYDEPVILAAQTTLSRGVARMGRICEMPEGVTLASLAADVGRRLGVRPTVWGDPMRQVRVAATAPGSGRSLVPAALAANVDVLLTGELRYHESLDAVASGLCVIEAGHDATEWPMVPVLAAMAARTPGLGERAVIVDRARAEWWTAEGA